MPDWAVVLIGVLGLIVGAAITEFGRWRERRERYQAIIFPKRLEAHQQALAFCYDMETLLLSLHPVEQKKVDELSDLGDKAIEWLKNNLLYLDELSRMGMSNSLIFTRHAIEEVDHAIPSPIEDEVKKMEVKDAEHLFFGFHQGQVSTKTTLEAIAQVDQTMEYLIKGIGAKYLPELKKL